MVPVIINDTIRLYKPKWLEYSKYKAATDSELLDFKDKKLKELSKDFNSSLRKNKVKSRTRNTKAKVIQISNGVYKTSNGTGMLFVEKIEDDYFCSSSSLWAKGSIKTLPLIVEVKNNFKPLMDQLNALGKERKELEDILSNPKDKGSKDIKQKAADRISSIQKESRLISRKMRNIKNDIIFMKGKFRVLKRALEESNGGKISYSNKLELIKLI